MRSNKHFPKYIGLFLVILLGSKTMGQNLLQQKVSDLQIENIVERVSDWRKEQLNIWLHKVDELPQDVKNALVIDAEKANDYDWPSLKAMTFLDFKRNGNRTNYEGDKRARQSNFNTLLVGELIERKGRFIPQIVNGLWLILEESTWVSPAHLPYQKLGVGLPHALDPYIDLAAGRQAVDIALAYFLFKDEFDALSKHINVRILAELERRILTPYLEREDYWWMGFDRSFVNNWNIWINTNMLKTFLLIEHDNERLVKGLRKIMVSSDKFINYYPEDGACEEGPSYWMHSGGELGIMLTWLDAVSAGKISFAEEEKIKNMGRYILHTHIAGNRFVNFADANAIETVNPTKIWYYGVLFDDADMKGFASFMNRQNKTKINNNSICDFLEQSNIYRELSHTAADYQRPVWHFYESMGLVTLNSNHPKGNLFFAAIGSHNGVSHNHNDVGSYMVYMDSKPVLIDVGVGTYNAKTFSSQRYEIWNMQSQWHNLPLINGTVQKDGREFKAKDVAFSEVKSGYRYSVDISGAYPAKAAVKSWVRNFEFRPKENTIQVAEIFALEKDLETSQLVFLTSSRPLIENNKIRISVDTSRQVIINFSAKHVSAEVEALSMEDPRLKRVWGDNIYRIKVDIPSEKEKGRVDYSITTAF